MSLLCLPATGTGIQPWKLSWEQLMANITFISVGPNSSGKAGENILQPPLFKGTAGPQAAAGAPLAQFGTGNQHIISFKSDSDRSNLPAPSPEATETLVPSQERGSPGLQSHSKDVTLTPVPAPGATGRLLPGKGRGWSRSWHTLSEARPLSPTLGTERSNPGMQQNLEDGTESGRNGLRQVQS
ncbi:hypothetical protein DV515_00014478 [Chloebia gouldiae]|uniref:Uncharacterized protein n=1 Tax=Chloebia gouldiae TaxID=44316 RepID=A0A3L8RZG7_CHLGU|nr:hypothetical protein DV515_00014478 [Chloebia gouldiae]